ncbi:MAG: ribonuclease HII [Hyphomonadaceae bacterium]|nr:ribonuclease HII [Hyphomonadaceae bacterium]
MAICGIDEAGRGPWAGPVTAAAVILPRMRRPRGLADSKTLSEEARAALALEIRACALVGVGWASAAEIDALNIRVATHLAMRRALEALPTPPAAALVDGNDAPDLGCPVEAIVDGDAHVACIAAASIIAKTARDAAMTALCAQHPGYGFAQHKGYGTPQHQAALARLGPCAIHRRSFKPVRALLAAPISSP